VERQNGKPPRGEKRKAHRFRRRKEQELRWGGVNPVGGRKRIEIGAFAIQTEGEKKRGETQIERGKTGRPVLGCFS